MKPFARDFSMTAGPVLGLGAAVCLLLGPASAMAQAACAAPVLLPPDLVAEAKKPHPYPTFCSIPAIPTDVRSAEGFKAAVQDVQFAKAELAAQVAPDRWSLNDTEGFAAGARSTAAPPPPMSTEADTEAFLKAMKKRATPPPRPR
jgi:hypothetical protein